MKIIFVYLVLVYMNQTIILKQKFLNDKYLTTHHFTAKIKHL
jgi:hypothetical protein